MAFNQVYIAAHYPLDVIVGLGLGAAVAAVGWLALRVRLTALTAWLRRQPGVRSGFTDFPAPALPETIDTPDRADTWVGHRR